jgi:hypothetical protein
MIEAVVMHGEWSMVNSVIKVQVCDATGDDGSNEAGLIKILFFIILQILQIKVQTIFTPSLFIVVTWV